MGTGRVEPSRAHLERVLAIAQRAGDAVMRFYGAAGVVEQKADATPLTAADRASHDVILDALDVWTPEVPVISEEGDLPPYETRREWPGFWLVNPLDGTKEFLAGNGEFTVNLALVEHGVPVLGAVVAPALGVAYVAGAGLGAWRTAGGDTVRLLARPRGGAVTRVVESRSHPSPRLEAFLSILGPVERIPLGSSLKFCRVAEGAANLYPRFGRTMEWDVAAGDCIFRNSGPGGTPRRSPLTYNNPTLSIPEFILGDLDPVRGQPREVQAR